MKAAVCYEWGGPEVLRIEDFPSAPIPKGHVRVKVQAAGIGFQDTLLIAGKYQTKPAFPVCPGSEICGVVCEIGLGVIDLKVGDRIIALLHYGGYAEEVILPEAAAVTIPSNINDRDASVLGIAYGTAYQGLADRAQVKPGETVLVRGAAGGVGIAAVQIAAAMGATVIAAAGSSARRDLARAQGAHHVIDSDAPKFRDALFEITNGRGVDVVVDTVGSNFREAVLRTIGWRGRILIVGFAGGEIPQIPAHYILNKFCSVSSVWWGRSFFEKEPETYRATLTRLIEMYRTKTIAPIVSRVCKLEMAHNVLVDLTASRLEGRACIVFPHQVI